MQVKLRCHDFEKSPKWDGIEDHGLMNVDFIQKPEFRRINWETGRQRDLSMHPIKQQQENVLCSILL
jgi:hypothetical protein